VISIYGIIISISIATALFIAEHFAKKDSRNVEYLWESALYTIIFGVIGARIYHVIDFSSYYLHAPLQILALWNGGMAYYGALIGGLLGLTYFIKRRKLDLVYWLDIAALVTPLAQAIGRIGNYFNHEVYGLPTTLPWGITIPKEKLPEQFSENTKFHPLFAYEAVLNLILFLILITIKKRTKIHKGIILKTYLFGYALIRFSLEFLRIDSWTILGINVAQTVSVVIVLSALFLLRPTKLWHNR